MKIFAFFVTQKLVVHFWLCSRGEIAPLFPFLIIGTYFVFVNLAGVASVGR